MSKTRASCTFCTALSELTDFRMISQSAMVQVIELLNNNDQCMVQVIKLLNNNDQYMVQVIELSNNNDQCNGIRYNLNPCPKTLYV